MKKLLISLLAALTISQLASPPALAEAHLAQYGTQYVLPFKLYNTDGTLDVDEADGGTEVSVRCQGGSNTTATNDFVDRGSDYEVTITATEMQCATVIVTIAATTTEVVYINTVNNASAAIPMLDADVREWTGSDLLTGTGPLPALGILDRGNLQSDSTSITQLRSAATFADDEVIGATNLLYSATTGAGQRCLISDYVGSTDTATCSPVLVTDPTGTVRYELYGTAAGAGLTAPTAAENADAVLDELLSGHTTSGSLGERVGRIPNAAAGGNGGLPTVNASNQIVGLQVFDEDSTTMDINATPTGAAASVTGNVGGNVVGSVASVTAGVTVTTNNDKTGYALSTAGVNAIRDMIIEDQGNITLACALATILAGVGGDTDVTGSSGIIEEATGVETRITYTISSGDRSATISCPTL